LTPKPEGDKAPVPKKSAGPPAAEAIIVTPSELPDHPEAFLVLSQESSSIEWGYPFPPAEEIAKFSQIDPDLPAEILHRCLSAWEAEGKHRRRWEWAALVLDFWPVAVGQILAFVLAFFLFQGSIALIREGHSIAGLAGIIAQIAALAAVFYWGRRDRKPDEPPRPEPSSKESSAAPGKTSPRKPRSKTTQQQ